MSFTAKWQGSTEVAVKVQNEKSVATAAFLDEAQILKTLAHPNILELRGVSSEFDPIYLLIEYLPHGQLSRYLREVGHSLTDSNLIYIGAQVGDICYLGIVEMKPIRTLFACIDLLLYYFVSISL